MTKAVDRAADERRTAARPVLEAFGLQLEVSNARLADLLTLDAMAALTTDVRELVSEPVPVTVGIDAEAVEARELEEAAALRQRFRRAVSEAGVGLGFEVGADGMWRSPLGLSLLTRSFELSLDLETARRYVHQLAACAAPDAQSLTSVLLVAESPVSVHAFATAIRQAGLQDRFRVVSAANLARVGDLLASGAIDHRGCLVILAPVACIDAGDLLELIEPHAAA